MSEVINLSEVAAKKRAALLGEEIVASSNRIVSFEDWIDSLDEAALINAALYAHIALRNTKETDQTVISGMETNVITIMNRLSASQHEAVEAKIVELLTNERPNPIRAVK
jgi:hypothetical protein